MIARLLKTFWTLLFLTISTCLVAQDFPALPNPPRLVNDFTATLTPAQIEHLEQKLVAFDDSTSNNIAVVIVQTTGGMDVADYAVELGRRWGV